MSHKNLQRATKLTKAGVIVPRVGPSIQVFYREFADLSRYTGRYLRAIRARKFNFNGELQR